MSENRIENRLENAAKEVNEVPDVKISLVKKHELGEVLDWTFEEPEHNVIALSLPVSLEDFDRDVRPLLEGLRPINYEHLIVEIERDGKKEGFIQTALLYRQKDKDFATVEYAIPNLERGYPTMLRRMVKKLDELVDVFRDVLCFGSVLNKRIWKDVTEEIFAGTSKEIEVDFKPDVRTYRMADFELPVKTHPRLSNVLKNYQDVLEETFNHNVAIGACPCLDQDLVCCDQDDIDEYASYMDDKDAAFWCAQQDHQIVTSGLSVKILKKHPRLHTIEFELTDAPWVKLSAYCPDYSAFRGILPGHETDIEFIAVAIDVHEAENVCESFAGEGFERVKASYAIEHPEVNPEDISTVKVHRQKICTIEEIQSYPTGYARLLTKVFAEQYVEIDRSLEFWWTVLTDIAPDRAIACPLYASEVISDRLRNYDADRFDTRVLLVASRGDWPETIYLQRKESETDVIYLPE